MNKRMRELMASIQKKTAEAKELMESKEVDKANALLDEVDSLQKEFDTEKRIYEAEKLHVSDAEPHADEDEEKEEEISSEALFAKEIRAAMNPRKYGSDKALNETTAEDGGYTVPEDIQTAINHYREANYSFLDEIAVENVSTNKGARTYQKKADVDTFVDIDENGAITKEIEAPKFERITYTIQDRAGFMPVSNDLINDSDANITSVCSEWLARADVATANAKVLEIVKKHDAVEIDGIDGIKQIINVTLGQAYKGTSKIITNDDGLNYLDTLKDSNGRYLLNPDPTDSARLQLRCGANVVPVGVVPNNVMPSDGDSIPMIIGDLKEGIRKFDRQQMTLDASDVATIGSFNAFSQNMTLIRAILRDDYEEIDGDAYVYGTITAEDGATAEP